MDMLTFLAPQLLWLLPLAALPLLLHLLSRQLPPRLAFPTTRFLLKSPQPQQSRRRWRDWLLMLCRMALVALAALALAGPRWMPPPQEAAAPHAPALAVLLDASASMRPHAETARRTAQALLAEHSGWETAAIAFDLEPRTLDAERLDAWEPGFAEARPAAALGVLRGWLDQHASAPARKVVVISDFQRSNWSGALPALPPETTVELVAVPEAAETANAAITAVQTMPLDERQLRLRVSWRNWSDQPQRRTLRVSLGERELRQDLELQPHAEGATAIVTEWSPAENRGAATLEPPDALPADDQFCFWAQRTPPTPVLLLLPDGATDTALADELEFFLQRALTAERPGIPGRFAVQSLGASALPLVDLRNFALVLLAGSAERLPPEAAQSLQAHLAAGGGVIFIPGGAPVAAWRFLAEHGLLNAPEQGLLRQPTGLGDVPPKTLLARLFPPAAPSDLHLFTIRQLLRVTPATDDAVLLQTLDGLPALLRHDTTGHGALYAFTFAFHHEISDFPLAQAFLPILREISAAATDGHSEVIRMHCGEPFPTMHALDGTPMTPELLEDTARPGLARLGPHPVEINVSPLEAPPEHAPLDEIRRVLLRPQTDAENAPATAVAAPPPGVRDLRGHCLAAIAAIAILEMLLLLGGRTAHRDSERHIFTTLWK